MPLPVRGFEHSEGGNLTGMAENTVVRSGARGAIAAMAMTGLRRISTTSGLLGHTPPEAVLADRLPRLLERIPVARRPVLVEAAHLGYGMVGGVVFGALPRRLRRRGWIGPAYGVLFWSIYELGIAPALRLLPGRRSHTEQLALLADHLLYGVVVAASPWPYRDE